MVAFSIGFGTVCGFLIASGLWGAYISWTPAAWFLFAFFLSDLIYRWFLMDESGRIDGWKQDL